MVVSLVTAVASDRADYLRACAESVDEARRFIDIQWIVVWDGAATQSGFGADVEIEGRPGSGISCTRNLALPAIEHEFVSTIDADDLIVADGLLAAADLLSHRSDLGWVGLSRTFLDGARTPHTVLEPTAFAAGELAMQWSSPFPFHPNSIMVRAAILRRVGGWPAISVNEDLGLALRVSEDAGGQVLSDVLTRYRTWDGQELARADYSATKRLAFAFIETWINAVRDSRGRDNAQAPGDPGGAIGRVRETRR